LLACPVLLFGARGRAHFAHHESGTVSGMRFVRPRFPRPDPVAPLTPRRAAPRSPTSSLPWVRPTSPFRPSPACGLRPSWCGQRRHPPQAERGSPGSRAERFRACSSSLTAPGLGAPRDTGALRVAFRLSGQRRHPKGLISRLISSARTYPCQHFVPAVTRRGA
jgi:hypothetical protein